MNKEDVPAENIINGIVRRFVPGLDTPIRDESPDLTRQHKELLNAVIAGNVNSERFTDELRSRFVPRTAAQLKAQTAGLGAMEKFFLVEQGANDREQKDYRRYRALYGKESLRCRVELDRDGNISDFHVAFD